MVSTRLMSPLAVAFLLFALGCQGGNGPGTGGGSQAASVTDRVLELVNAERTSRGLAALTRNTRLDAAAQAHADDMADNKFFDHTGSDGSDPGSRATAAGYAWTAIAESIGLGDVNAEDIVNGWMNSPGHRANILSTIYTETGIAINDSGVATTWVQVFCRS